MRVGDLSIAVFEVDGKLVAVENVCRHVGNPIDDGLVEKGCVTCPWHGWRYDLRTGEHVTFFGRRVYRDQVDVREDLRGRSYYWIGGPEEQATDLPGSDCSAVREGLVSLTPMGLDLTHKELIGDLARWEVGKFVREAVEHAKT